MIFSLLTRLLLWLLIVGIGYAILLKWLPQKYYTWLGGIIIFVLIASNFWNPGTVIVTDLWRLLTAPLTPLGLSACLILSGMLYFKDNEMQKPGKSLLWSGFAILVIFSIPIVAYSMATYAEWDLIIQAQERASMCQSPCPGMSLQNVRAIVLLGQDTTETIKPNGASTAQTTIEYQPIQLRDRGNSLFYTVQIFWSEIAEKRDPLVLVTGGYRFQVLPNTGPAPPSEAEDIAQLLEELGVHPSNLRPISQGNNLYRSAVEVKKILTDQGLQGTPVLLVTSALQMRRAQLTFTQLGVPTLARPTDFITLQPRVNWRQIRLYDIIPSAEALSLSSQVTNEYLATIYYFLRGWLSPFL